MPRSRLAPDSTLALCAAVCSALLLLPGGGWLLDVAASFSLQLAGLALLLGLSRLSLRRWGAAALWGVTVLLSLPPVLLSLSTVAPVAPAEEGSLRVMVQNVHTSNRAFTLTTDAVAQAAPDVFVALEVDETWATFLAQTLRPVMPHSTALPRSDNFGIALFSRSPMDAAVVRTAPLGVPSIEAVVQAGGGLVEIIATHPVPPLSTRWWDARNRHIEAVLGDARASSLPTLIVGDLNLAITSPQWHRLIGPSGWRRVQVGPLPSGTWPALLGPVGVALDHALVGEGLVATGFQVVPGVGSDHRGIVVDIRLGP